MSLDKAASNSMFFSKDKRLKKSQPQDSGMVASKPDHIKLQCVFCFDMNDMNDMNMSIELCISLAMMRVTPSSSLKSIHGSNSAACLRATGFFGWGCFFSPKNGTFVDSASI